VRASVREREVQHSSTTAGFSMSFSGRALQMAVVTFVGVTSGIYIFTPIVDNIKEQVLTLAPPAYSLTSPLALLFLSHLVPPFLSPTPHTLTLTLSPHTHTHTLNESLVGQSFVFSAVVSSRILTDHLLAPLRHSCGVQVEAGERAARHETGSVRARGESHRWQDGEVKPPPSV
jgi:hypothetical protein